MPLKARSALTRALATPEAFRLHKAFQPDRQPVADQTHDVLDGDGSCVKRLAWGTAQHFSDGSSSHGSGTSALCLTAALCAGYGGFLDDELTDAGGGGKSIQHQLVVYIIFFCDGEQSTRQDAAGSGR